MKILLTGPRGVGKTFIGRKLAMKLNLKFIDLDEFIIKKNKIDISLMVEKFGWNFFRTEEYKASKKLSKLKDIVLATGGGTLMFKRNLKLFSNWIKILLITKPEIAIKRIRQDSKNRPSLTGKKDYISEWKEIYNMRKNKYYKISDFIVDTSFSKSLEKILNFIHSKSFIDKFEDICISIKPKTLKELEEKIKNVPGYVKYIEVRAEEIPKIKLEKIIQTPFNLIYSDYSGKNLEKLVKAYKLGFSFVTLDFQNKEHLKLFSKIPSYKIILSYHNFKNTPKKSQLFKIVKKMLKYNPEILKIITTSKNFKDNKLIESFIKEYFKKYKTPLICFAMGEKGKDTRINSIKLGTLFTFCALDKYSKTADGQITLNEYESFRDNR